MSNALNATSLSLNKEDGENYTLGDMLTQLQTLTPKQLTQQVRWIGENGQGKVSELWVLDEHHIDPSGEGLEPVSSYLPGEGEDFDPETHMSDEELLAEPTWPMGYVFIVTA
jgi:hypothetical protein